MESLTPYQANRIRVAVRTISEKRIATGPGMEYSLAIKPTESRWQ